MKSSFPTAQERGLLRCQLCGFLMRKESKGFEGIPCARCGHGVYVRKPHSLQRTTALIVAAAILYVPANVLPIMHTATLTYDEDDTILSGIIALWSGTSWPLAIFVFCVSILVPLLKLIALSLLVLSTYSRWSGRLKERSALYRLLEFIGRWSMLDVFVVSLLVALVQLRGLATVRAGSGAIAFAAVVILTMCASQAFDPRLMWDYSMRDKKDSGT